MNTKIMLYLFLAVSFIIVEGCRCKPQPQPERDCQQCVDFEPPLALGTQYGASAGKNSGDVIFTTNGINVSVHKFIVNSGGTTFGNVEIRIPTYPFGINQAAFTMGINLGFDFSNIGFIPTEVQFEFLDQGAHQNLSVNGSNVYTGSLSAAPSQIGGVNVAVFMTTVSGTSHSKGVVILRGAVKSLTVGGQEFWIDQVCAKR